MHKNNDERLKIEKNKLIYGVAMVQNLLLASELIYERVSENRPMREIITLGNPVAMALLVFLIPFLLISVIYSVKNDDDDQISHLPIFIGSLILTAIFAGCVFLMDGAISASTGILILIVGTFIFLFSEFINIYRYK